MKKLVIASIVVLLAVPAVASADYVVHQTSHGYLYKTTTYTVDQFTDSGNHCYVTTSHLSGYAGGDVTAISCVKD